MARLENILDMYGTIRRLEESYLEEPDPRIRMEIAETLDILNTSLGVELNRLKKETDNKTKAA